MCKSLWINFLCNPVKVAEDNSTLGESEHTIEGALSFHHVNEVCDDLFKAMHNFWGRRIILLPARKLEPGTEMRASLTHKLQQISAGVFLALEGGIDDDKVNHLVENLAEVTYLVLHYI